MPQDAETAESGASAEPGGASLSAEIDLPRPTLPPPKGPTWVEIAPDRLQALRDEASEAALADDCLGVLRRLRGELANPAHAMPFAVAAHLFAEVRDYLLNVDRLPALKKFGALLWEMTEENPPAWDRQRPAALYDLLDSCGDRRAEKRLLRSVPTEERRLRPGSSRSSTACPGSRSSPSWTRWRRGGGPGHAGGGAADPRALARGASRACSSSASCSRGAGPPRTCSG